MRAPASEHRLADESSTASLRAHGVDLAASRARQHLTLLTFAMRDRQTASALHHVEAALTQLAIAKRHLQAKAGRT